jgi:hypothetical protein
MMSLRKVDPYTATGVAFSAEHKALLLAIGQAGAFKVEGGT